MTLIYIILSLHYLFYIFFTILFTEFVYTSTNSIKLKIAAYLISIGVALVDALVITSNFKPVFLFQSVIIAYFATILFTVVMKFLKKLDLTLWLSFSILFTPIVVFPAIIFLVLIQKHFVALKIKPLFLGIECLEK